MGWPSNFFGPGPPSVHRAFPASARPAKATTPRSSSREVRIRVPTFSVVHLGEPSPPKKVGEKGHLAGGPRHVFLPSAREEKKDKQTKKKRPRRRRRRLRRPRLGISKEPRNLFNFNIAIPWMVAKSRSRTTWGFHGGNHSLLVVTLGNHIIRWCRMLCIHSMFCSWLDRQGMRDGMTQMTLEEPSVRLASL